ncbi:glycoside hydrolase family 31 protein [Lacticaseibacillus jixiensis]|uniref:glycoside hydrolase family 31 protein n=1 Tax=Lacticaseibacillus jixiensis TaxID=3231926 RepID=UPI0036F27A04
MESAAMTFEFGQYQIAVITASIVRISARASPTPSYAVVGDAIPVAVTITRTTSFLSLSTTAMQVVVDQAGHVDAFAPDGTPLVCDYRQQRIPLARDISEEQAELVQAEGHHVTKAVDSAPVSVVKAIHANEHFYGLGDKTGFLDKRGYVYENWNTDEPSQLEETTRIYKSIPFVIGLHDGHPYGLFFDNTYHSRFDLGHENPEYFVYSAEDGVLDYYLIAGPTMAEVVTNYTYLTGRTPLPQKWTLGYQQSRFSYKTAQEVRQIANHFRQLALPIDAIHLDIDYMDGYRVFTIDPRRFPDMPALANELRQQGIKLVSIIDPGVKEDPNYPIYQQGVAKHLFALAPDGQPYINEVWPGRAAYPDFGQAKTRQWWADNQRFLVDHGISGVWNDMNEPASFKGPIADDAIFHDENRLSHIDQMHNVYGHNMAKATYAGLKTATGKRPFVITRAAYAGTQRYSTVWTGDNRSSWAHLQMAIPQLCNLGLSGFSFCGTDIGGFLADTSAELLIRWVQAALFSPLLRNHSCAGTRLQEPWQFDDTTLTIYRDYLKLRYRLIDYLYDLMAAGEHTGLPVMRPLVLADASDEHLANLNDEYLVGSDLLAAPVVTPSTTTRLIYLPAGTWIDYWTHLEYAGQQYLQVDAPLDRLPLFVRANSILPIRPASDHVDVAAETSLTFQVWGSQGEYDHYQDNGEDFAYQGGAYNRYHVRATADAASITLTHQGYAHPYQAITVRGSFGEQVFTYDAATHQYQHDLSPHWLP